jgi:type I restriction enzyme S subunit
MHQLKTKESLKETKIGLIPEEWELLKLGEIGELKNGINKDKDQFGFGFPLVNLNDVFQIDTSHDKDFSLVNSTPKERCLYSLKEGDVLFVRSSVKPEGVGLTAVITKSIKDAVYSGFLIRFRDSGVLNLEFKKHCFNELGFRRRLLAKSTISANTNINQVALNSLLIAVPPHPEQQKIGEILSTWDKAISTTQKLVDELKLRNKGLAQQLLIGKKRLNGFQDEWRHLRIGDVADQQTIFNKYSEDIEVLSCTKYDGLVRSLDYFGRQVFGEDLSKYKIVPKGSFAYATNHIEEGSIGYQNLMDKGLVSPMYTVFKTKADINDEFFFRLLKTDRMIYAYQSNTSGSIARRGGLRWNDFSTLHISIPSLKEQAAINSVLSEADMELKLHQKQLDTLKEQKKGLMQKLLTGEIRVKTE